MPSGQSILLAARKSPISIEKGMLGNSTGTKETSLLLLPSLLVCLRIGRLVSAAFWDCLLYVEQQPNRSNRFPAASCRIHVIITPETNCSSTHHRGDLSSCERPTSTIKQRPTFIFWQYNCLGDSRATHIVCSALQLLLPGTIFFSRKPRLRCVKGTTFSALCFLTG